MTEVRDQCTSLTKAFAVSALDQRPAASICLRSTGRLIQCICRLVLVLIPLTSRFSRIQALFRPPYPSFFPTTHLHSRTAAPVLFQLRLCVHKRFRIRVANATVPVWRRPLESVDGPRSDQQGWPTSLQGVLGPSVDSPLPHPPSLLTFYITIPTCCSSFTTAASLIL